MAPMAQMPPMESMFAAPVPEDEPAIDPATTPGAMQTGVIAQYQPEKGFGFIRVEGMQEIFFPREALPEAFRARSQSELPKLQGVHVSFEMPRDNPSKKGQLRTGSVQL